MDQPMDQIAASEATGDNSSRLVSAPSSPTLPDEISTSEATGNNGSRPVSVPSSITLPDEISQDLGSTGPQTGETGRGDVHDDTSKIAPTINLGTSMFPQQRKNITQTSESRRIQQESMQKVAQMYKAQLQSKRPAEQDVEPQDDPAVYQNQTLGPVEEDPHMLGMQYNQARREYNRKMAEGGLTTGYESKFLKIEKKFQDWEKQIKNPLPEETDQGDEEDEEIDDEEEDTIFVPETQGKRKAKDKGKVKSRNDEPPAKKQKGRPAGKKNGKAKATPKPKKGKKSTGRNVKNVLQPSNIFNDLEAAENLAEDQPGFNFSKVKGSRERALKGILANVAADSKKSAVTDKHALNSAMKDFTGVGSVKPAEGGKWSVKGMKTSLTSHQIMSTGFMRRRESGPEGSASGGILADQMGLGKFSVNSLICLANCGLRQDSHVLGLCCERKAKPKRHDRRCGFASCHPHCGSIIPHKPVDCRNRKAYHQRRSET